jgi:hypothetical protein
MPMGKKKPEIQVDYGDHHPEAVAALIVEEWLTSPKSSHDKIATAVNKTSGTRINADSVKAAIKAARKRGWLRFKVPEAAELVNRVYSKARVRSATTRLHVLNSDSAEHIATAIANHVLDQIVDKLRDQNEIHIGFFGGRTNSFVARLLVGLLRRDAECRVKRKGVGNPYDGDRRLVLHALVGVLDSDDPETDPNSFPVFFIQHREVIEWHLQRKLAFKKLAMPGLVTNGDFELYRKHSPSVRHAFEQKPDYDLIIASCGHAGHRYTLTDYIHAGIRDCPELVQKLAEMRDYFTTQRVLGDIAWHPVLAGGKPVDLAALPLRVATLFTLPELKQLAAKGGKPQIILAVGPCSDPHCFDSKSDLLRWILEAPPIMAHEIFVDRHSVEDYLGDGKDD